MKRTVIIMIAGVLFSLAARSQENSVALSGGYAFANIEDADSDATGFRINGVYEFNPGAGKFSHGLSVGYIRTTGESAAGSRSAVAYTFNSWPVYYAPKLLIGKGSIRGFIKGALGAQTTSFKRTGAIGELKDSDFGFYGGAGAGVMKYVGGKMFINLEYEWTYLSNSAYKDGFMNAVTLGAGFRF